jgi:hypothetical protein
MNLISNLPGCITKCAKDIPNGTLVNEFDERSKCVENAGVDDLDCRWCCRRLKIESGKYYLVGIGRFGFTEEISCDMLLHYRSININ